MTVDTHFLGPLGEESEHDVVTRTSTLSTVDVAVGKDLSLTERSLEPLVACRGRGREGCEPRVETVEDFYETDEMNDWLERVTNVEQGDLRGKRKWSKRLSKGIVDVGQKIARKLSSVSQNVFHSSLL